MIILTQSIKNTLLENPQFAKDITMSIKRHIRQDWGELCEEEKNINSISYKEKKGGTVGIYDTCEGAIHIIADFKKEITTVSFANELIERNF